MQSHGRKNLSLDGRWQMIVDPYESGYYDYVTKGLVSGTPDYVYHFMQVRMVILGTPNRKPKATEFGGDALFGNHGDVLARSTEKYQENLYRHQIAMAETDSVSARHGEVDADGLPVAAQTVTENSGLLEPQRFAFESW